MALIQSSAVSNSSGAADNVVSLTGVTPGSLLVITVAFSQQTNSNPPTIAGWTAAQNPAGQIFLGAAWVGSCIFWKYATSPNEVATIVRGASSTLTLMTAVMSEYVSGLTSNPVDVSTNNPFATGTSNNSGTTGATSVAGELVIAALGMVDAAAGINAAFGISDPATTGYSTLGVHNDNTAVGTAFQASYKYVTATGTQVATWTWTPSSAGIGTIATFKLAPRIDTQPITTKANVGGTATFTIAATTSNGTLSYQWKSNGSNVGTDSTSYTTGTLTNSNQWDQITCVVTDTNGSTTSSAATLIVAFAAAGTGPQRRRPVGAFPVGTLRWQGVVSASGVTGSLAYTNANDTLAASGTTTVTGTLARTNANDTLAASGTTTVTGTLARTNANDTLAASGSPIASGALATTNANDTLAASGSVGGTVTGTLATTNANDTLAATGTTTVTGSLAKTNANDTLAASGTTTVTGALATTNANDTLAATGTTTVTGSLATTNANDTLVANGTVGSTTVTGTLAYTNNDDTLSAFGIVPIIDDGNPHFIWGPFIHGSHLTLSQKLKKKVPDEVLTIIEEVVTPTLASTNLPQEARLTLQQSESLLRAELKAQNILWKVAYRDALIELRNQQTEEETVVMMLFAM